MSSEPLLSYREVVAGYTGPVGRPVSFDLHPGDVLGLVGPNGCGKSTLIGALTGASRVFAGEVVRGTGVSIGYQRQRPVRDADVPLRADELLHLTGADAEPPDLLVDVATLTVGARQALGPDVGAYFASRDAPANAFQQAASEVSDPVWRLPLPADYRKMLDSDVADMKNVGGPHGGALTAGLVLKEFVGETPWVHLDIAGPSWADADEGWLTKGGTACGVRTFVELLDAFSKPNKRKA